MKPSRTAELFASTGAHHAEGPFWDERTDRLLFVDALAGSIHSVDPAGVITRFQLPSPVVTVIRRRTSSGWAVATEHGIAVCDESFDTCEPIALVLADPELRTNDGGCDPLGGFIIGTMAYQQPSQKGAVYRVAPDHRITCLLENISISNGVQWSTDATLVFYIDTPTRRVDAFDVDPLTGAWSNRRPYIQIGHTDGVPDGMAMDEHGGLWVALWDGGAVHHYDPAGRLVETIAVPGVSQVSSCTFGGPDRSILFITTSRQNLAPTEQPLAGSVFAVQTDLRGSTPAEFAG